MAGYDDLERRLREERPEARDEFVQRVAGEVRGRRTHPSARPRMTLAFALSAALLVSMVAFGGVGAAKNAVSSSTDSIRSAWGDNGGRRHHHGKEPSEHQYHAKVLICVPHARYIITYKWVDKWVWVWQKDDNNGSSALRKHRHHHRHHGHKVWVLVHKKIRIRVRVIVYETKRVRQSQVPELVAEGAVYPVPAGGCSSLNPPGTGDDNDGDNDGSTNSSS